MNYNIYNSIILAGVIQGLIFGAVVFLSEKYNHKSVYFLATIIVTYSFNNLQYYFVDIGLIDYDTFFKYYYFPWAELVPALLYFYVLSFLFPENKNSKKSKWLLSLFGLHFLISTVYKVLVRINSKSEFLEQLTGVLRYYSAYYAELVTGLLGICILVILFFKIKIYQKTHFEFQRHYIRLDLNWLKITMLLFLVLTLLNVYLVVTDMTLFDDISYYPVWILLTIIIYWLGHIGIYKYGIVEERKQIRQKKSVKRAPISESKTKHIIIERLKQYLENEKRFLDSSLTLEKTADTLELSQGHLSKIINTELEISFKDYINTLRVEEAKSYLKDKDFSNYTLVAIGLEAGFNSKSAFNTSFKKITGETPSQFKQRHIN
ncbi:helix-turn-helix domain-containing protein [Psychroserpens sp. Hel_I_66]|uniref:helix-turn-helix domain-containing protein n=1 Tax=Psychroserpens sp. Hel_I_66 TaxID=1250004 RepID=UPI0006464288|nr:AraC family transcriptional regulator [Psychroserpens sp. Hel_I_66]